MHDRTTIFQVPQDVLFLASELETSEPADDWVPEIREQLNAVISRYGACVSVAGLLLSLFDRLEQPQRFLIWTQLSQSLQTDLLHLMMVVQPQMTVKLLTARRLADVLARSNDAWLHDRVAEGLCQIAVADSEMCLPVLEPAAQRRLASTLAERAGRISDSEPCWLTDLIPSNVNVAKLSFVFGALSADREDIFARVASDLLPADWDILRLWLRQKTFDMSANSIRIFLRHTPRSGYGEQEHPTSARKLRETLSKSTPAVSPSVVLTHVQQATVETFDECLREAGYIQSPTWRKDIERALLRRAIELQLKLPRAAFSCLTRSDVQREFLIHRLLRGRLDLLRRTAWTDIEFPTRFTLLQRIIRLLQLGCIRRTGLNVLLVANAISVMPNPVRNALASQFVETLGHLDETNIQSFDIIHKIALDDHQLLASIARAFALRGQGDRSRAATELASNVLGQASAKSALDRLNYVFGNWDEFPGNRVEAIGAVLATVVGNDFSHALRFSVERLSAKDAELVIADLISRSRATEVLVEAL